MKDLRFRRLEQYRVGGSRDQMQLSVPLPKSPSGKAYQYSPNPEASPRLFLIGAPPEERVIPKERAARIRAGDLPPTIGFFFGQSDGTEMEEDLLFVTQARDAIARGYTVFYDSWW